MIHCRVELTRGAFRLAGELSFPPGITALFGPSGAGKSSMLRCLAGLESPARGRIEADGEVWFDDGAGVDVAAHHRAVGLVFQDSALFPHLSVARNLAYGWERAGRPGGRQAFAATVGAMGLEGLENRVPRTLSGGERQRVALGRALLRGPRVLLLDEPLGALDQEARSRMLDFLDRRLRELAIPVVYVTHALGEVLRLADRVIRLEAGRVRDRGGVVEMAPRLGAGDRAGVVVDVRESRLDRDAGLVHLDTTLGPIRLPPEPGADGPPPRRLRILARDVSLTLSRATDTSILNVLPGRVEGIGSGHQPLVEVRVGEGLLLARITDHSLRALDLAPGCEVFVQVKGVAVVG